MSTLDRRRDAPTMDIWRRNFATDVHFDGPDSPQTTKPITGKSYQGTSLDPVYVVQRLTQEFGPIGEGWGIEVEHEQFLEGEPYFNDKGQPIGTELLHLVRCRMWWKRPEGERNSFICCGGTQARYRTSKGRWVVDEDVLKKSLTDALTKGAAYLGIGADIHAGRWDSSKYVAERAEAEQRKHAGIQAEEKVAAIADSLANCEDAGAVRAYLAQEGFKVWIGRQERNHPQVYAKVQELIEQAWQRVAPAEGVPEESEPQAEYAPEDHGEAGPHPQPASPPPWHYVNSKGEVQDFGSLEQWVKEWRIRVAAMEAAKKPARARHEALEGMLARNGEVLRAVAEHHAETAGIITRRVVRAQTALRGLDADSLEPVNHSGEN